MKRHTISKFVLCKNYVNVLFIAQLHTTQFNFISSGADCILSSSQLNSSLLYQLQ